MSNIKIGQKVVVRGDPGTVRFFGTTSFASGDWVGVELDAPKGRHDGSVQGVEYFQCRQQGNHGIFVRPSLIETSTSGTPAPSDVKSVVGKLQVKLKSAVEEIKRCKDTIEALETTLTNTQGRHDELEVALESSTVELEYFRSKNTTLVESLNALQLNYNELDAERTILAEELEIHRELEEAIQAQSTFDDISKEDFEVLLLHNKKLEMALSSLRQVSQDRNYEFNKELQSLRDQLALSSDMKTSYETLSVKLAHSEQVIEQLQEQLESTAESEQIIERLTTDNDRLQSKVSELNATVQDLTELYELDRSLEADHQKTQEQLNSTIAKLDTEMNQKREQLSKLKATNLALSDEVKRLKDSSSKRQSFLRDNELELVTLELKKLKTEFAANATAKSTLEQNLSKLEAILAKSIPETYSERIMLLVMLKKLETMCSVIEAHLNSGETSESAIVSVYDLSRLSNVLSLLTSVIESSKEIHTDLNSIAEALSNLERHFESQVAHLGPESTFDTKKAEQFVVEILKTPIVEVSKASQARYRGSELVTEITQVCKLLNLLENHANVDVVDSDISSQIKRLTSLCADVESKVQDFGDFLQPSSVELQDVYELNSFRVTRLVPTLLGLFHEIEISRATNLSEELNKASIDLNSIYSEYKEGCDLLDLRPPISQSQQNSIYSLFNKQRSLDEPVRSDASISDKDKAIEELHLQIELLEHNLNLTTSGKQAELEAVDALLKESRSEHQSLKQKFDELTASNEDLERRIRSIEENDQNTNPSQIEAIESLQGEGYSKEMALFDEIVLLRNLLQTKLSTESEPLSDTSWLSLPITKKSRPKSSDSKFTVMARRKRSEATVLSETIMRKKERHRFGIFRI